jgi:hypothetical protein
LHTGFNASCTIRHPAARSAGADIVSQCFGGGGDPDIGTMSRPSVVHDSAELRLGTSAENCLARDCPMTNSSLVFVPAHRIKRPCCAAVKEAKASLTPCFPSAVMGARHMDSDVVAPAASYITRSVEISCGVVQSLRLSAQGPDARSAVVALGRQVAVAVSSSSSTASM